MNNTIPHVVSRGGVAALMVTLVMHMTVAAGIIWGGWMDTKSMGLNPKPREVLITVDISDTITTQPIPAATQTEQREEVTPKLKQPKKTNIFIPVNPKSIPPDPPENNTPFYSNANTKAANEKPKKINQQQPFIGGENDLFPGTFNNNNSSLNPIQKSATQPAQTATAPRPIPHVQLQPHKSPKIPHEQITINKGPFTQTKEEQSILSGKIQANDAPKEPIPLQNKTANNSLVPTLPGRLENTRAPTLSDQKRRLKTGMLASRKMKQEGGVTHIGVPALDVRLTGYGDYDARFVQAVRLAWLRFREKPGWFHPGRVVVDFKLHHDGTISELTVQKNAATAVQSYYCKEALTGPAPFEKWTEAMLREIGTNVRSCRFSFHYLLR